MITINNKTSENEVIDVEENSSYDENKGNTNEALESDDHCENNSIIDDESDNKKKTHVSIRLLLIFVSVWSN